MWVKKVAYTILGQMRPEQRCPGQMGTRTNGSIKLATSKFGRKLFTFYNIRRHFSDLYFVIEDFN